MAREDNLKKFSSDYQPEKNGRPKGSKNRSTIAKYWLSIEQDLKNPLSGNTEKMSQEDLMTLALIKKAREGDVNSYKALMDSTYGTPIQQIDNNTHLTGGVNINLLNKEDIDKLNNL